MRHDLRVDYEFNISDFNQPGKAFGEEDLNDAIRRGAIVILDDKTIADMKAKRARDKERDMAQQEANAIASGEATDWKEALKRMGGTKPIMRSQTSSWQHANLLLASQHYNKATFKVAFFMLLNFVMTPIYIRCNAAIPTLTLHQPRWQTA